MMIALSGLPGAGKTTLAKHLADFFGIRWYSMGDLRGRMAQERGITIDALNELGMQDPSTDREVDDYQQKLGTSGESFVIDGWMTWYFIPQAFKLFLCVDPMEGARRVFETKRHLSGGKDEPEYLSVEETRRVLEARVANSRERYRKYYGMDFLDSSHYDAFLDTTAYERPEQTFEKALSLLEAWRAGECRREDGKKS
ncbi:MAG TPA: cytidylate kinase family protein [Patescibacteria group bacterium]|nr:cytidylate kinase family protein [Patescibacteria group bacterium]